ncbi:MAG: N-6 DNA methylase, partial [Thermoproteota archaeon]|nr:N-6 DNA methylase [Thermoproteota archaeon]
MMAFQEIKNLLSALGFAPSGADGNVFVKRYPHHKRYILKVDFQDKKISYGKDIRVNHQNVLGFDDRENFVVLECVNRLLEKGYEPRHIELERMVPVGHTPVAGRADVTVYDRKGKTLFVVECKTFGEEYEYAKRKLQTNVGQLFTYLQQDRNTRFLCLYASRFDGANIVYENLVIRTRDSEDVLKKARKDPEHPAYLNAAEAKDFHRVWREQYDAFTTPNGIFDEGVTAYNPDQVPIKRKDLKPFSEEEGRKFFNEFAEILRHNNISDNSNAFNRILSLVLCKIVDEQKSPEEITEFQIQDAKESAEAIQDRLQKLYAEGMGKFLKERIVYISEKEIERVLRSFPNQAAKDRIRTLFIQQKFYSNNEFAFKEVHNERLFRENAKVLIEILQLLQYKQFRYERKDSAEYKKQKRYLGEFFELLLDAGYKQTAGQFFTPLPIAKFIITALPIREIIRSKIEQKQLDFLPLLIDYACGSGHFLVEAIEEIQEAVEELQPVYDDETNNRIRQWQTTDWTKGFLYGIEKDYRLARTAKLACFMNGDGETNIILGDGLEDHSQTDPNFPQSFDILAANPPYSIKDFKSHTLKSLKHNSFDLMKYLSDSASEIEVLFIERLAQLLHANGVCGVILPKTILSNTGIYTKAREVLLRNFEIRAVIEFGPNTFMETTTNTVSLFLKRREAKTAIDAEYVADDFITHNKERENDFADTLNILAVYARTLGFTLAEYKTFLSRRPNDAVVKSDWYKDYWRWFENLAETKKLRNDKRFLAKSEEAQVEIIEHRFFNAVQAKEKDKFEFFFLVYGQKTLVIRAHTEQRQEKRFIGYEFSKKRGFEGIKLYKLNGKHQTALYDEDNLQNPDKLNYMVRQMLVPELYDYQSNNVINSLPSTVSLNKQSQIVDLTDCIDFSRIEFEKAINLSAKTHSDGSLSSAYSYALTPVRN